MGRSGCSSPPTKELHVLAVSDTRSLINKMPSPFALEKSFHAVTFFQSNLLSLVSREAPVVRVRIVVSAAVVGQDVL